LRPVYTAVNAEMAALRFEEFADKWGARYLAIIRLWRSAWQEFIPSLDYDVEIRKIICSTNAIESLNARYRRAVRARGHFPTAHPPRIDIRAPSTGPTRKSPFEFSPPRSARRFYIADLAEAIMAIRCGVAAIL
jgi:hypothetical protein